jgi:hypothetical protein
MVYLSTEEVANWNLLILIYGLLTEGKNPPPFYTWIGLMVYWDKATSILQTYTST